MMKRRTFLQSGLALPFLGGLSGLGGCGDSSPNMYLGGNYGPVGSESTILDLKVIGEIPKELVGRFLRNGPNPGADADPSKHHWFTGRGMVHGMRLADGKAQWYRSRFVGDENNSPNTNVIGHGGRTIAIVESGGLPYEMSYELEQEHANETFGGGFTAHPKVDPETGELHAICYDWANLQDHVRYVVIDAEGDLAHEVDIPMQGMSMIHDMSITKNYAIVYDFPVTLSFVALGTGASFPFRWDPEHPARVGLLPREGSAEDVVWCPVSQQYAYHPMNAYEDADGNVVIDIVRYDSMFDSDVRGPFGDSIPTLSRWTVNPGTLTVSEETVHERGQEFPRCHPDLNGKPYRYGYAAGYDNYDFPMIYKHDMQTGDVRQWDMGPGRNTAEPVFVPREGGSAEDDGFIMTYVYDKARDASDFMIFDAADVTRPAIAQVQLPSRVPYGFHGNWIAGA